jgi:hypothetical protein
MLVLFETPAGYALFTILDEGLSFFVALFMVAA